MSFRQHYEDELNHLRELGRDYSERYPKLAPFLGKAASDPDVERLLEGFAFLTAKLWQKVDDHLPELSYDLMQVIAPQHLTTQPSCSILEFQPATGAQAVGHVVKAGHAIDVQKAGQRFGFKTVYDVTVQPLSITQVDTERQDQQLLIKVSLQTPKNINIDQLSLSSLRLYLAGDLKQAYWLYYALLGRLQAVQLQSGTHISQCPQARCLPVGLKAPEALLASLALPMSQQHLLQEFFSFPEKWMFIDVVGLDGYQRFTGQNQMVLTFVIDLPAQTKFKLAADSLRLNCTPIVNLMDLSASPIRRDHRQVHYPVRIDDKRYGSSGVAAIKQVTGWVDGDDKVRHYHSLAAFANTAGQAGNVYQWQVRPGQLSKAPQHYLAFPLPDDPQAFTRAETLSIEVSAFQTNASEVLNLGDISLPVGEKDHQLGYRNITALSLPVYPPLTSDFHWQLTANLASHFQGLVELKHLQRLIRSYYFAAPENLQSLAMAEQLADALKTLSSTPLERLHKGQRIRGSKTRIHVQESAFVNTGELYLFGVLINTLLQQRAAVNSFNELEWVGIETGGILSWPTTF